MRLNIALLLLCGSVSSAATITSGTLTAIVSSFPEWWIRVSGPGLQLEAYRGGGFFSPQLGVPLCTDTCTYDFSGTIFAAGPSISSFVLNGSTYEPNRQGYSVRLSMTFTGTPQTATAVCTICPTDRPGPKQWETNWTSNPFTMTGVITLTQNSFSNVIFTENISGYGFTTAFSRISEQRSDSDYSATTFTFVPEPTTFVLAGAGGLLVLLLKRR